MRIDNYPVLLLHRCLFYILHELNIIRSNDSSVLVQNWSWVWIKMPFLYTLHSVPALWFISHHSTTQTCISLVSEGMLMAVKASYMFFFYSLQIHTYITQYCILKVCCKFFCWFKSFNCEEISSTSKRNMFKMMHTHMILGLILVA